MALGARRQDILRLIVEDGAKLALAGVALGAVAALMSARMLTTLLYGVKTTGPAIYLGAIALLFLTALAACFLPACRVVTIDPMRVLRSE